MTEQTPASRPGAANVIIIGTGPTALAAAMACRRLGVPFEVIDVGYDLESEREDDVQSLARVDPASWPQAQVDKLFPLPVTSTNGVGKRFSFGSNFFYQRPPNLTLTTEHCTVDVSHGYGGFGNVWGAAILPYAPHDLTDWPITASDLAASYRNVATFMPTSAEPDDLAREFPIHAGNATALRRSEQADRLLRELGVRQEALRRHGVAFGRARLAVDSSGATTSCRYCGHCLEGCAYGSLFNPRLIWKRLEQEGATIHRGFYALDVQEQGDRVTVNTVDMQTGAPRQWHASRLFLGAGALATTRFLARSLGLTGKPIRVLDSQYFFFPLLAWRGARDVTVRFALAELFVELLNPRISRHYVHFQVYGLNEVFRQTLRSMVPSWVSRAGLLSLVESRFYLFQGFLHSDDSGHMEMTITASRPTGDDVHIRGVPNSVSRRVASQAHALLRGSLSRFGFTPWLSLKMVALGRSFHAGGSFPMGSHDPVFTSDRIGRPAGLGRVHILDASTFPAIPATTITYPAMANADRVVTETVARGLLP